MTMIISLSFYVAVILVLAIGGLAAIRHTLKEMLAGKLPVARAWNPNTHDRITQNALELLRNEKGTLLGWVLQQKDTESLEQLLIQPLRRGSVDEDMSSNIWRSLLSRVAKWFLENEAEIRNQTYEGTNGSYHFFNPDRDPSEAGLSEPTEQGKVISDSAILALPKECKTVPMPSAYIRAFEPNKPPGYTDKWCLDFEKRNYTVEDGESYFFGGYYHLSFYTMGRVLHLLQDMAVPAHVRNDCHFGMLDDNPEPLEYYTDYVDSLGIGIQREPAIERWSFRPRRTYSFELRTEAEGWYSKIRNDPKFQTLPEIFKNLARHTHDTHYSFGTIPGNGDSHKPVDNSTPLYLESPGIDYSKCKPNTGAVVDVLLLIAAEITLLKAYFAEKFNGPPPPLFSGLEYKENVTNYELISFIDRLLEEITLEIVPGRFVTREDVLEEIRYRGTPGREKGRHDVQYLMDVFSDFTGRNAISVLRSLRLSFKATGSPQEGLKADISKRDAEGLREMTNFFKSPPDHLDTKYSLIRKPSNNPSRNWHKGFHGPFCLANNNDEVKVEKGLPDKTDYDTIIENQRRETVSSAIGASALFISNWFESLFQPGENGEVKRGIGIWLNENSASANEFPPLQGELQMVKNNDDAWEFNEKSGPTALTIGIVNHLPVTLDMNLEISIEKFEPAGNNSLEDFPEFANGIILNVFCGQYINDWVKREKPGEERPMKKITGLNISEKTSVSVELTRATPYNAMTVSRFPVPEENVSPHDKSTPMGGIRRDLEKKRLIEVRCGPPIDNKMRIKDEEVGFKSIKPMEYAAILRLELAAEEAR